jgi:hypothetical protein
MLERYACPVLAQALAGFSVEETHVLQFSSVILAMEPRKTLVLHNGLTALFHRTADRPAAAVLVVAQVAREGIVDVE